MSKFRLMIAPFIPRALERVIRSFREKRLHKLNIEELPREMYDEKLTFYKISLCITCMNRLYQLKHTLLQNIEDNIDYPNLEICLVNYNSSDGLDDYIRTHFSAYIRKGILRYIYTDEPAYFHCSKAKNLSHFFSTGEIVCNLDGDNFTGKDFAFYVNYLFNTYGDNTVFHFRKNPFWGTDGRIALTRKAFLKLGGYDEEFFPTALQDFDLLERGKKTGLNYQVIGIENFLRHISNTKEEKTINIGPKRRSWYYYNEENKKIAATKYRKGLFIANTSIDKHIELEINFEKKVVHYKPYQE